MIKILDYIASLFILLGIYFCEKDKRWWLVYLVGSIIFVVVSISKGLPGFAIMGTLTGISAAKNYIQSRK